MFRSITDKMWKYHWVLDGHLVEGGIDYKDKVQQPQVCPVFTTRDMEYNLSPHDDQNYGYFLGIYYSIYYIPKYSFVFAKSLVNDCP